MCTDSEPHTPQWSKIRSLHQHHNFAFRNCNWKKYRLSPSPEAESAPVVVNVNVLHSPLIMPCCVHDPSVLYGAVHFMDCANIDNNGLKDQRPGWRVIKTPGGTWGGLTPSGSQLIQPTSHVIEMDWPFHDCYSIFTAPLDNLLWTLNVMKCRPMAGMSCSFMSVTQCRVEFLVGDMVVADTLEIIFGCWISACDHCSFLCILPLKNAKKN